MESNKVSFLSLTFPSTPPTVIINTEKKIYEGKRNEKHALQASTTPTSSFFPGSFTPLD